MRAIVHPDFELVSHKSIKIPAGVRIIPECDECQHQATSPAYDKYSVAAESMRGRLIYQTMSRNESLVFIRLNTRGYRRDGVNAGFSSLAQRLQLLQNHLSFFSFASLDCQYEDWYCFYTTDNGKPTVLLDPTFDKYTADRVTKVIA